MRGMAVTAAVAALLAGCEGPDPVDGANVAVAPAAAATVPAGEAPATGKTIPANLLGVYAASLAACGKPSDSYLSVEPTELRFHESIGTVRRVAAAADGTVSVEADYQGEGESWRSTRELRPGDGGATLTVSGDDTSLVRVRCPAETR